MVGCGALSPTTSLSIAADTAFPACEDNLRDRLWMWGHDPGVRDGPNGVYNIPLSPPISMADGIKSMRIPNVCVIRSGTPGEEYRKQYQDVKRVAWNLSRGANESYRALKDYVFGLRDTMPNLASYYLDDFFHIGDQLGFDTFLWKTMRVALARTLPAATRPPTKPRFCPLP